MIALLFGFAYMVIFFTGVLLSAIGLICLIVYLVKRKKNKGQKKMKLGWLIAAIAFLALGLPSAIGVPVLLLLCQ